VEAGDLAGWIDFVRRWTEGLPMPVADVDEWATIEPHDRERVVVAALRYVQGFDAPDLGWLDIPDVFPRSTIAARAALQLIAATRPAFLDAIAEPALRRWCPVLVAVPFPPMSDAERTELISRCATFDELATTIVRVARRDNRRGSHVGVLYELPRSLPEPLHATLLLVAPEFGDDEFEDAVELLLRAGNERVRDLARTAVRDAVPARAARAARVLLPREPAQWSMVITRMQHERDFVDVFVPLVVDHEVMEESPLRSLTAQRAAELFLVLLRQYPPADDPRGSQGMLTLPDYIERLRLSITSMLVEAGSADAVRALEWLLDQEPGLETLRYRLIEAKQKLADAVWMPIPVEELWSTLTPGDEAATRSRGDQASETVPPVTLSSSQRRDVGRDEISALCAGVHILVETATSIETAAVHAAMLPLPGEQALVVGSIGVATYTIGTLGNYAVAHFQSDMGNEGPNAAQLATNDAIREMQPKLLLLIGNAFGLQPGKQRLGDVLVAQHMTSYEMVKLRPESVEERGETLRADATLIERVQAHGRTWQLQRADGSLVAFHIGRMLSGAKLVNNRNFRDELTRRFPMAIGGEMEGLGAYAAAFRDHVPVLLAKGICDWADGTKNDLAQPFAAMAATDLIRHTMSKPDAFAALGIPARR
jgi:nucleoside phosphorylase